MGVTLDLIEGIRNPR